MVEGEPDEKRIEFQPEEWPSAGLKQPLTLRVVGGANLPEDVLEKRVSAELPHIQESLDLYPDMNPSEVYFFPAEVIWGPKATPPLTEEG